MNEKEQEIYDLLLKMLHAIKQGDADTYTRLTSKELTCIEPETGGHIVDGLPFHLFLVERTSNDQEYHIEVVNPKIKVYDDTAYTSYTLIVTRWDEGEPVFNQFYETRIFHKEHGLWKMVHFHRSE